MVLDTFLIVAGEKA